MIVKFDLILIGWGGRVGGGVGKGLVWERKGVNGRAQEMQKSLERHYFRLHILNSFNYSVFSLLMDSLSLYFGVYYSPFHNYLPSFSAQYTVKRVRNRNGL